MAGADLRNLARVLDGGPLPPASDHAAFVGAAIEQGVAALLAKQAACASLDSTAAAQLHEHVRVAALRNEVMDAELRRLLVELAADGLTPLVLKGAHLAHAVYPHPALRPRADTDLLIRDRERDRYAAVFGRCGYTPAHHVRGRLILGQFHFERVDRAGVGHYLDVHWRAAAPLLIERALPAAALFSCAVPLPAQGVHARAPSLPYALLLSCVHAASHHWPNPDLLWLFDLRAIAAAMTRRDAEVFLGIARRGACCTVAAAALDAARAMFDSDALTALSARLRSAADPREPSAALLRVRRPVDALWIDMRTAGWIDRARLVREHLLPDREFIRDQSGGRPLAIAYVGRALRGLRRWVSVSDADRRAARGE